MARRKADIVEEMTMRCLTPNGLERVLKTFIEMNPLEADDCLRAFWNKASVGNLRKYDEMINGSDDIPVPADILDESDMPSNVAELEIIDDDDWDEDEVDEIEEDEEYDENWFDL